MLPEQEQPVLGYFDHNNPLWQETLEPSASLNVANEVELSQAQELEIIQAADFTPVEDLPENSPNLFASSGNDTLTFDSLFSNIEEPLLPDVSKDCGVPNTSELSMVAGQEDPMLKDFWEEEPIAQSTKTFSLPIAQPESVTNNDAWTNILNDLSSSITDPWEEELNNDLTLVNNSWQEALNGLSSSINDAGEEQLETNLSGLENNFSTFDRLESLTLDLSSNIQDQETSNLETLAVEAELDDFADLDALLEDEEFLSTTSTASFQEDFDQLEALLDLDPHSVAEPITADHGFDDLDDLLADNEFDDLDDLLNEGETTAEVTTAPAHNATVQSPVQSQPSQAAANTPRRGAFEQTMRVPIKQLDNFGNMMGELVVYRNSLEQSQERLRQFLDSLLHQVQQLGDVGSRMQELYERSLLEASLLSTRQNARATAFITATPSSERHATGLDFDSLEMDSFTGFHTLTQEMIELIVRVRESSSDIEFITGETEQVARQFRQVTGQLQEGLTQSRMVPFAQIAERLPRAVRDIALKYGKQAELQIEGEETLIDKMLLEQLYDPMTHLVNNAISHGIETSEERSANGKSPIGKITIRAYHQGNQTVISVADDGAGIDTDRVMTKAIQKGLITVAEARTMSRLDVYNLLFHPGFSTRDQVDDFAGRGVGMDVVRTSLTQIRGIINTDSTLGKGTTFTIRLPLTLSICKALCCVSDKARIAFPMDGVEEMLDVSASDVQINAEGQSCITWRGCLLPFRPLKELLSYNRQVGRGNLYGNNRDDDLISIVVLRSADAFLALQVDQVLGEQEIVIKQLEAPVPKPIGVAGATVLGDGRVMPIGDVLELIDLAMGRLQPTDSATLWKQNATPTLTEIPVAVKTEPMVLIVDDSITVRELLSMTFTKAGYRVEQARDGKEAWEKLRDGLPCDLVFCDIEMPRMDGLELLSRMQQDSKLSNLPIAMLTSRGSDRHRQMALQLGARGYFTKPYLEEFLLDGAQRMLKGEVLLTATTSKV